MFRRAFLTVKRTVIFNMKLQRFIENYRRGNLETPTSHSPDRQYVFKTSESIGTLNSRDEFSSDRSFVVKEHNLATNPNTESIQHLRELCESDREQSKLRRFCCDQNEEVEKTLSEEIEQLEKGQAYYKKSEQKKTFVKNKSAALLQQDGEISFSFYPDNTEGFYQEAPSELYEGCPTEQVGSLRHEQSWFIQNYSELLSKMKDLQAENDRLKDELQAAEKIGEMLSQKQSVLLSEICVLRPEVSQVIQENIQIQNKIKELLLKQQMQKFRFFPVVGELSNDLRNCTSSINLNERFYLERQKH